MPNQGGFAVGKFLNFGFIGTRSRGQSDIIENRPFRSTDTGAIPFGSPVVLNPDNTYSLWGTVATTLQGALTLSTAYTSLTVAALPDAVDVGDTVTLTSGANTQSTTVTTAAAVGATAIAVASFTANFAYPVGSTVNISNTFAKFAGIAVREVKQATSYLNAPNGTSQYNPGDPCDVLQVGSITVMCQNGAPTAGGPVYIRTVLNGTYPNAVISGFEAIADGTNSVQITNAQWKTGNIDANLTSELTLLTRNNA